MSKKGMPPNPGGMLETYHFGLGQPHWKSYGGKDLYGDAALDKYEQYSDGSFTAEHNAMRKKRRDEDD